MKEGPDIALLGSLIGDPARANILIALMSGKALTATELATEAGVTLQTTSSHLKKLQDAQLIRQRKQGRHRYFELGDSDVGTVLESMMGLAAKRGLVRTQTGPKDGALRKARICYNHLAGDLGVQIFEAMVSNRHLMEIHDDIQLTDTGQQFVESFGIDLSEISKSKRPLCKSCLDWSSRRTHLAGALGTAFLQRFYDLKWATRVENSRIINFSSHGEKALFQAFEIKQG
jgi:DNA-binding transcriptional ArsR family regulator